MSDTTVNEPVEESDDRPLVAEVAELAYEQATTALDQQAEVLSEVRSRTSTLVAVTALVATFLGKEALATDAPGIAAAALTTVALIALAAGIFCCIQVLKPTQKAAAEAPCDPPVASGPKGAPDTVGLSFNLNVERLLDDALERGRVDYDSLRLSAARSLGSCWESNSAIVDAKLDWFDRGCWALLAQTIFWILLLGWGEVIT